VVATHVQRLRQDQDDRAPRARIVRKTRDATAGLTVTRLASHDGQLTFAGTASYRNQNCPYRLGSRGMITASSAHQSMRMPCGVWRSAERACPS